MIHLIDKSFTCPFPHYIFIFHNQLYIMRFFTSSAGIISPCFDTFVSQPWFKIFYILNRAPSIRDTDIIYRCTVH